MSRIKVKAQPAKRGTLNTTINDDVLKEFKSHCKEMGLPMNLLLESFMSQFIDGEFVLKFGIEDDEDSKE